MQSEKDHDYKGAAQFFSELQTAASNNRGIEELLSRDDDGTNISQKTAYNALKSALCNMRRYDSNDLRHLVEAGYRIDPGVIIACTPGQLETYQGRADEFMKYFTKPKAKDTGEFLRSHSDHIDMFKRFLTAYAQISEYEGKLADLKKTEALRRVLDSKPKPQQS